MSVLLHILNVESRPQEKNSVGQKLKRKDAEEEKQIIEKRKGENRSFIKKWVMERKWVKT